MSKFLTLDGLSHFLGKIKGIFVGAATNTTENHVVTFGTDGKTIKDSGYTIASNVPANAKFTDTTYSAATTSKNGLMTAADKTKLDGIATGANKYTLPAATASVLGGVKTGSNITNSSGTISITKDNVTAALGYTPPTTNTTYSNMTAATSSEAGKAGLVPAPAAGKHTSFLRGDGTWVIPTNTTYNVFVKSGTGAAAGLVPAPSTTAGTTKYLREDGTWVVPPNTTYNVATTSANGLMSSADKSKLNGIAAGAQVNVIESVKVNGTSLTPSSKAVNIDLSTYAKKGDLNSYVTSSNLNTALSSYAKKTDIANVYLYKGSVASYSELPTSATAGWVYNIETADDANNIKAGDNVAWNGTAWDNLSGILDIGISEISTDEIDTLFS